MGSVDVERVLLDGRNQGLTWSGQKSISRSLTGVHLVAIWGGLVKYPGSSALACLAAYPTRLLHHSLFSLTVEVHHDSLPRVKPRSRRWRAGAQPMLEYFLAFQESCNRFPGFNYEVQGVFQEREQGRIKFYTYVVRE